MKEIRFVDVGEGITEGHIRKWLVRDGDSVREDQAVVQVETDKAVVSVPSPITGTIRIAAQESTTVHVGDLVAQIGEPAELEAAAKQPQQQQAQRQTQPAAAGQPQAATTNAREPMATPSVRKLAHDLNVERRSCP